MTITFLQPDGVPVTAQQERQGRAAQHGGGAGRPLGGRSGFRVDTPSNILTVTSTTWTLGPCSAQIDPGATTHQGMYGWATDANVTGTITAADSTYARKDIVYIRISDGSSGDGTVGTPTAPVVYVQGTPAASPVAPTLPSRAFLVGTITVPVAGGGTPTAVLNPARYVAAGGIQPVFSQTERDGLTKYDNLTVRRADLPTKPIQVWTADAAKWLTTNGPGTAYVPIWNGIQDFGTGGGLTGTYWVDGDRVHVRSRARFGANATLGNGVVRCPVPPGFPISGTESVHLGGGTYVPAAGQNRNLTVYGDAGAASVWVASDPIKTPGDAALSAAAGSFFEIVFSYQTSAV